MKLTVKFFASVREAAGLQEDIVQLADNATLRDLISELTSRYGKQFEREILDERKLPSQHIQYLIDGENARQLGGYDSKLHDGAEVAVLPPVGGGDESCFISQILLDDSGI